MALSVCSILKCKIARIITQNQNLTSCATAVYNGATCFDRILVWESRRLIGDTSSFSPDELSGHVVPSIDLCLCEHIFFKMEQYNGFRIIADCLEASLRSVQVPIWWLHKKKCNWSTSIVPLFGFIN